MQVLVIETDFDIPHLITGIKDKNPWVEKNIRYYRFRGVHGSKPKQIMVLIDNDAPAYLTELEDAVDRFTKGKERKI